MALVFTLCCAFATTALLWAEMRGMSALRVPAKSAAALSFLAAAIAGGALDTDFGRLLLSGLAACALGDVLLLSRRAAAFLAGMAAFAVGHALYAGAFLNAGVAYTPAAVAGAGAMAASALGLFMWLRPHLGAFAAPVAAYCVIISAMVAASFGYWAAGGESGAALSGAAAAFALSDVAVARDRFVDPSPRNRMWGLPLYFAAQCAFALNV